MTNVFAGCLASPDIADVHDDAAIVQAMLDFQASLARAKAAAGMISTAAASTIARSCKAEIYDIAQLARAGQHAGSLAIPLVGALRENVALFDVAAARHVHTGATSQDVIDTAMVLVARRALAHIDADLERMLAAALRLASAHAATPMLARTLMQAAAVTTFGWKCAGWALALHHCRQRLAQSRIAALRLQLGGAAGTLDQLGEHADAIVRSMAADLGLGVATPWHTQREAWVGLACDLGLLTGTVGKIARDIALLSQGEVGEVAEPEQAGRGGSSAMPHKRNPVASLIGIAAALRTPSRVACLMAAMPQEHERGLGSWQAELAEWPDLVIAVGGSTRAMATALEGLQVFAPRMRANIEATNGSVFAEAAAALLADVLPPGAGAALVGELCADMPRRHRRRTCRRCCSRRCGALRYAAGSTPGKCAPCSRSSRSSRGSPNAPANWWRPSATRLACSPRVTAAQIPRGERPSRSSLLRRQGNLSPGANVSAERARRSKRAVPQGRSGSSVRMDNKTTDKERAKVREEPGRPGRTRQPSGAVASAQTTMGNVTIFGLLDVNVTHYKQRLELATPPAPARCQAARAMEDGTVNGLNGSR